MLSKLAKLIAPILFPLIIEELEKLINSDINGDGKIG